MPRRIFQYLWFQCSSPFGSLLTNSVIDGAIGVCTIVYLGTLNYLTLYSSCTWWFSPFHHVTSLFLHGSRVTTFSRGVLHTSLAMVVWHHMTGIFIRVHHRHRHQRNEKQNTLRSQPKFPRSFRFRLSVRTSVLHGCSAGAAKLHVLCGMPPVSSDRPTGGYRLYHF